MKDPTTVSSVKGKKNIPRCKLLILKASPRSIPNYNKNVKRAFKVQGICHVWPFHSAYGRQRASEDHQMS